MVLVTKTKNELSLEVHRLLSAFQTPRNDPGTALSGHRPERYMILTPTTSLTYAHSDCKTFPPQHVNSCIYQKLEARDA